MRTGIGGEILMIVAEKMALKAFGQRTCRGQVKCVRARKYLSGGGENSSAIGESDV